MNYNYPYFINLHGYPIVQQQSIPVVTSGIPTNGWKIKAPYIADTYLVDKQKRRRIQDAETFMGIFKNWEGLHPWDLQSVPLGAPIVRGTFLFKYPDSPKVYLYDRERGTRWVKRWIVSMNTFKFYNFDEKKIATMPRTFNPPDGSDIVADRRPYPEE